MFGFDNTRDTTAQPQGQDQQQPMGVPAMPDPMTSSDPQTSNDSVYDPTQHPAPTPDPVSYQMDSEPDQNAVSSQSDTASSDDIAKSLLTIKQDALQKLSPLVGHLDQSPEEKFKTTMMMIQASDDQSLVATAYEAANAIADSKVKAQALLDIVNEINYFTQHHTEG